MSMPFSFVRILCIGVLLLLATAWCTSQPLKVSAINPDKEFEPSWVVIWADKQMAGPSLCPEGTKHCAGYPGFTEGPCEFSWVQVEQDESDGDVSYYQAYTFHDTYDFDTPSDNCVLRFKGGADNIITLKLLDDEGTVVQQTGKTYGDCYSVFNNDLALGVTHKGSYTLDITVVDTGYVAWADVSGTLSCVCGGLGQPPCECPDQPTLACGPGTVYCDDVSKGCCCQDPNPCGNCDDGLACTTDTCVNNECVHTSTCNDGLDCTTDTCTANGCVFDDSNCCTTDADCQGGLCGVCDTFCSRVACSCGENRECTRVSVSDTSCTGGECNPWPEQCGNLQPHGLDCGGLPEDSCKWCVLDYWGPNGEGFWQCDPYPNAEILWPDQCGEGDGGSSTPPSSRRSSSRRSSVGNGTVDPDTGGDGEGSIGNGDDSGSEGNDTGGSAGSYGAPCTHYGTGSSLSCHSSASYSDSTDSGDDGGFSSEGADDLGDSSASSQISSLLGNSSSDASSQSSSSSENDDEADTDSISSGSADDGESSEATSSKKSSTAVVQSSVTSEYEQCDFCPACIACRRCGIGLMNVCDAEECGGLGLCVFESGLLGGSCLADPEICGVCE